MVVENLWTSGVLKKGIRIMRVKTTKGHEIDLKQEIFDGLKMRLRGPVLVPGDTSYEESRTV